MFIMFPLISWYWISWNRENWTTILNCWRFARFSYVKEREKKKGRDERFSVVNRFDWPRAIDSFTDGLPKLLCEEYPSSEIRFASSINRAAISRISTWLSIKINVKSNYRSIPSFAPFSALSAANDVRRAYIRLNIETVRALTRDELAAEKLWGKLQRSWRVEIRFRNNTEIFAARISCPFLSLFIKLQSNVLYSKAYMPRTHRCFSSLDLPEILPPFLTAFIRNELVEKRKSLSRWN